MSRRVPLFWAWASFSAALGDRLFGEQHVDRGSDLCPLDIDVLWTADVGAAVFSTPVLSPLHQQGSKHVVLATLSPYIEVLEADGSTPLGWPVAFEGSTFHASPVLQDINGDGVQDICIAATNGNVLWLEVGQYGRYLKDYHIKVPGLRVRKDWYVGLDQDNVEVYMSDVDFVMNHEDPAPREARSGREADELPGGNGAGGGGSGSSPRGVGATTMRVTLAVNLASIRRGEGGGGEGGWQQRGHGQAQGGDGHQPGLGSGPSLDPGSDHARPRARRVLQALREPETRGQPEAESRTGVDEGLDASMEEAGDREGGGMGRRLGEAEATAAAGGGGGAFGGDGGDSLGDEGDGGMDEGYDAVYGYGTEPYGFYDGTYGFLGDDLMAGYWEGYQWGGGHYGQGGGLSEEESVLVDAHILAPPAVVDVNGDGVAEMILPVSYYFDKRRYASSGKGGGEHVPPGGQGPASADRDPREPQAGVGAGGAAGAPPGTAEAAEGFRPEKYVVGGVVCWDFVSGEWIWSRHLDQTTAETERTAHIYAVPTVADLDGDGRLEVLLGTGLGLVYVLDAQDGRLRKPEFPYTMEGEIQAQVAVADVAGDDKLEILVGDMRGTLACLSSSGEEIWSRQLSGPVASMPTVGDVDGDGSLDVVVAVTDTDTDLDGKGGEGRVWVVRGQDGLDLPRFPAGLRNRHGVSTAVTLVDLHERSAGLGGATAVTAAGGMGEKLGLSKGSGRVPRGGRGPGLHLVVASMDGHLYVLEGATGCTNKVDLGEPVMAMVLADDLMGDGTVDLVVGTLSGQVVALDTNVPYHPLNKWTSSARGGLNGFTHGFHQGIYILLGAPSSQYERVATEDLAVTFEIVDRRRPVSDGGDATTPWYQVSISVGRSGRHPLFKRVYKQAGVYTERVSLHVPQVANLVVSMVNDKGQYFEDTVTVQYNTEFHLALKWMLILPLLLGTLPLLFLGRVGPHPLPA